MSEAVAPSTPSTGTSEGQAPIGQQVENTTQENEKPAPVERRKLKAKINGKEREVYEDDILRDYQKYTSADEKLREAAQQQKNIDAFFYALEHNPESILNDSRLPINKRELAMKWLTEQIESELQVQDPKDAKMSELEKRIAEYENKEKREEETRLEQQRREFTEQRKEIIANTLSKAMELSPLSKDPEVAAATLREMAMHMRLCRQAGYEVTPEELASHVEKKSMGSMQILAGRLEGEDLINFLGEDVVTKLRRADLTRLKKAREVEPPQTVDNWSRAETKERKFYDPSELRLR